MTRPTPSLRMLTLALIAALGTAQLGSAQLGSAQLDTAQAPIAVLVPDSTPARPPIAALALDSVARTGIGPLADDSGSPRPRAIEYSDWYARRLAIHRIGSYTMLPLFGAEYALGQNLLNDSRPASWLRPTHAGVAGAIGALFVVNTVTGAWNLWDSRKDPAGRTRRTLHAILLLASDAGFVWAGASGGERERSIYGVSGPSVSQERRHRNIALGSMALSTAGTAMMWLWKQ